VTWCEGEGDGPACLVCGGRRYTRSRVLWDGLVTEWGLSAEEAEFIDRQQGVRCAGCGCNLRSIALAGGVCDAVGHTGLFVDWLATKPSHRTLEINGAGDLTKRLGGLSQLVRAAYPRVDMMSLPFAAGSFDLVVHSDTLEHVPDPETGIAECLRVLRPGGWLAMTVPVVPGRLTRSRTGLGPSYHGAPGQERADHLVQTEFGADAWCMLAGAGFERVSARVFAWPSGVCWSAQAPVTPYDATRG
jgi:SAM-dependent methyltransferase